MERRVSNAGIYGAAAISALIAFVSLFFNFSVVRGGTFRRTGFHIFQSGSGLNIALVVLTVIIALAIITIAVMRAAGMLRDHVYGYVFATLGTALAVLSLIMFITVIRISWAGATHTYTRGFGLILNLIFSILTAVLCFAPLLMDRAAGKDRRHTHEAR